MSEWFSRINDWRKMKATYTFNFSLVALNIVAPKNYIGWLFLVFELLLIIALVFSIKLLFIGGGV